MNAARLATAAFVTVLVAELLAKVLVERLAVRAFRAGFDAASSVEGVIADA